MVKSLALTLLFATALGSDIPVKMAENTGLKFKQNLGNVAGAGEQSEWGLLGLVAAAATSNTANERHNERLRQDPDPNWIVKEYSLHATKYPAPPPVPADKKPSVDMWFINLDEATDRQACMTEQLRQQGYEAKRYAAKHKVTGDCTKKGVDFHLSRSHASNNGNEDAIQQHVLSNWCNHKHAFEYLSSGKPGVGDSEYVMILEDDAVLTPNFRAVVEDFIVNFKGRHWDFIQIDPFGPMKPQPIAWHSDRPVYNANSFDAAKQHMWGMQALLARRSELPKLINWMDEHAAVPIDWIQKGIPTFLSYSGGIALQSEMNRIFDPRLNKEVYTDGVRVKPPQFCQKSIQRSSIALMQGSQKSEKLTLKQK